MYGSGWVACRLSIWGATMCVHCSAKLRATPRGQGAWRSSCRRCRCQWVGTPSSHVPHAPTPHSSHLRGDRVLDSGGHVTVVAPHGVGDGRGRACRGRGSQRLRSVRGGAGSTSAGVAVGQGGEAHAKIQAQISTTRCRRWRCQGSACSGGLSTACMHGGVGSHRSVGGWA